MIEKTIGNEGSGLSDPSARTRCVVCGHDLVHGDTYCSRSCTMKARPRKKTPLAERLWRRVIRTGGDGCHVWQGATDVFGYGIIGSDVGKRGSTIPTHRASWALAYGPIPEGLYVLHTCDNPPCVRPDHLFLGTKRDNNLDMVTKGRHAAQIGTQNAPSGERHRMAKLTEEQVLDIRSRHGARLASVQQLAEEHDVSMAHVYKIVRGESWKYLDERVAWIEN